MNIRTLIKQNYDDLLMIAIKMTGDKEVAEDLLHDAVSRMIKHEDKYDHRNFFGYAKVVMFRINSNNKRAGFISERGHAIFTARLYAYDHEIETDLHYKGMYQDILKTLDPKFRNIFMYKKDQYTSREIADEIGIVKNSIDGRYHRMKQMIKNKYRNDR